MGIIRDHMTAMRNLVFCSLFSLSTLATAAAPLEINVEDNADPFSQADGSGYANEVVKAAFAAVGVDIKLVVMPYARCKKQVIEARSVACFNMSAEPALSGKVKFADTPLFSVTPVYFEDIRRPLGIKSEAELRRGMRVGIIRDYEYPDSTMMAATRGVIFEGGRSEQNNLKKLAAGHLDAALVMSNELTGTRPFLREAGVGDNVRVAFVSSGRQIAYFGVSIKHPLGASTLEKYNEGIRIITKNGTLAGIKAKWSNR
ncbi:MAG TPA: transporter substrate-binding domain-containing protein [Rhodocyclaceae bacterium]|nr:transporter substrate-binding domain-containing protein [Rhodocyclaceae bacterium]